jgi:hypothetical protein
MSLCHDGRGMRGSLVAALIGLGLLFDQAAVDRSAQEPQYISTQVVVDPYDVPPPKRDSSRSYSVSTGQDTLDPNGVSPERPLLPVNES